VLPRAPQAATPQPFPILATIAPVIGSVALWAFTQSPFALVFALLGPVVAVASLGDGAWQRRRRSRRESARFERELAAARVAADAAHETERAERERSHPPAHTIVSVPHRDRWRGTAGAQTLVRVGTGVVRSSVELAGAVDVEAEPTDQDPIAELRARVTVLDRAAILVDARAGIGICGPPALAAAAARSVLLQLCNILSPRDVDLRVGPGAEPWVHDLPHYRGPANLAPGAVEFGSSARPGESDAASTTPAAIVVAVGRTEQSLPRECGVVLRIEGRGSTVRPPSLDALGDSVEPEYLSDEEARIAAGALALAAAATGMVRPARELPEHLGFGDAPNDRAGNPAPRRSLACIALSSAEGWVPLDLVADGPHALVGGTTGSGKSEFLLSWIIAMAARYGPHEVNFLLIDFKGGSSFGAAERLPHSVGLITDLDESSAHRAFMSLRAELRYRERALADAGARSIDELPSEHPLPRLVIVVDEFAAMVGDFPELHELFSDLASRGRSLGLHLILCTQRPAGVLRDAVLANCTLRVSLRVNNRPDSVAVVGTSAAAELPKSPAGRAAVSRDGGAPVIVQVAIADRAAVESVRSAWALPSPPPRRPWCDPLPSLIPSASLPRQRDTLAFGLLDLPEQQRQEPAHYRPALDGNLLVLGGHGAGKSGALDTLAAASGTAAPLRMPASAEGAWDFLVEHLAEVRAGRPHGRLLLLDDVDVLYGRYSDDYAEAVAEMIEQLLREGGRVGTRLVMTARRLPAGLHACAALCDSRLLLRMPNRQEHVLAGGDSGEFDAALPPGGGIWRGHRVQVAFDNAAEPEPPAPSAVPRASWRDAEGWAIVSVRPGELVRRLGALPASAPPIEVVELPATPVLHAPDLAVRQAHARRAIVADVATWQSQWGLLGALGQRHAIVFDGCSVADFRALTRQRQLPPPLRQHSDAVWLLTPDGVLRRARPPWL
jgi:S-DNA-T family DNA segregation ATPase FtsK/SpoIIIE